jgi:tetratricopeptide (TPR) repeat protein
MKIDRLDRALPLVALLGCLMAAAPSWAQDDGQAALSAANSTCRSAGTNPPRIEACTYVIANARLSRQLLTSSLASRGQAHRLDGNLAAAMADFDAALTIDPAYGWAWQGRAQILAAEGQAQAARDAYDTATRFDPTLTAPYAARAEALTSASDWPGLVAEADRMLAAIPDSSYAYRIRGIGRMRLNQLDAALADLDAAVRLAPEDAAAYGVRGLVHQTRGDDLRAFSDFDRAVTLTPQNVDWLQRRGSTLHRLARYPDAIADFEAINRLQAPTATVLNLLCWSRAVWGQQLDQALADCDASLRLSNSANTLDSRGLVHLKRGDAAAAFADYDAAHGLDPAMASALYGRGLAHIRLGREGEGRADLAAALTKDPKVAENYAEYGIPVP